MTVARYLGARLDGEMVFHDRETGRLIRLEPHAAAVWESCAEPSADAGRETSEAFRLPRPWSDVEEVLAELERAGMVMRVGRQWVRPAVEWTE
ncbi:MAG TPA: PqqD family peptide modification chaperone [bacterium]|nr:PqqD family peptide modification chaperone [bacterium]